LRYVQQVICGGSRAVTLQEVGRLAGYSRGIVNHMFGTKEALLTALVAGAQQRVAPPPGPGPGLGRLRQRAARYIDQISAGDEHARAFLLLWAESVGATPQLRAMFAERDNLFAREIREDLTCPRLPRLGACHSALRGLRRPSRLRAVQQVLQSGRGCGR
jgi:AcrR family transcriptional regulator